MRLLLRPLYGDVLELPVGEYLGIDIEGRKCYIEVVATQGGKVAIVNGLFSYDAAPIASYTEFPEVVYE